MLDILMGAAKEKLASELAEKAGIDSSQIGDILGVIGSSTTKEVSKEVVGGGLGTVMNLFSGKSNSDSASSLQEKIGSSIISGLAEKLGLDDKASQQVVTVALPLIMSVIAKKNDETPETDSSALEGIFGIAKSTLAGKGSKIAGDLLGGILGGNKA